MIFSPSLTASSGKSLRVLVSSKNVYNNQILQLYNLYESIISEEGEGVAAITFFTGGILRHLSRQRG